MAAKALASWSGVARTYVVAGGELVAVALVPVLLDDSLQPLWRGEEPLGLPVEADVGLLPEPELLGVGLRVATGAETRRPAVRIAATGEVEVGVAGVRQRADDVLRSTGARADEPSADQGVEAARYGQRGRAVDLLVALDDPFLKGARGGERLEDRADRIGGADRAVEERVPGIVEQSF